ncbi:MAG: DNA ligase D [Acidobacteriaceae bacterium]|jgi:bifunctional non-homologous end joining protein LigD
MAASRAKKAAKSKTTKPAADSASNAVDEQLARYRSMRDFKITAEPSGAKSKAKTKAAAQLPFVVQKHAATHLHYDFRLGWNGVLKSWAVAKGPSYVVADKRLAVQVEDHPMEYGGFEGVIPKGQYGGGTVMIWDQGWWEPQPAYPDVDAGLRTGSLKFILHGTKLKGKWALIRMHGKSGGSEAKPNWLLIKEHDDFERSASDPAVTDAEPNSVVTGRSIEEIASSEDHVWNSKDTRSAGQAWYRQKSKAAPIPQLDLSKQLAKLPRETQPTFLAPQLAQQAESPPARSGWLHELKLDGYRIQARKNGRRVQLFTRTGLDWTHRMKAIAAEVARLPVDKVTLDGEVVVLGDDGNTSFADLQAAFQEGARHVLTYFCFDLLHVNGHNTRNLPLRERKELLAEIVAGADEHTLRLSEHLESDGPTIFQNACKLRAEGIVSKRAAGKYAAGGSSDWIKCKCLHEQEFVIGGYTLPGAGHTGMRGVGALLLGYYDGGKLIYAGRVGTGFTEKTHKMLRDKLEPLKLASTPFESVPSEARAGALWVKPTLVAQVRFATWTADELVRQAAFLGLRDDKPATEVAREDSAPAPKSSKAVAPKRASHTAIAHPIAAKRSATDSVERAAKSEHAPVRLTHPAKVLDPESGLTKQALADYYWAVAARMLPHIAGRPLSLVRCPEGSAKACFFQKHVNATLPKGIGSVEVRDKKTGVVEPYITLDGKSATPEMLASLAQLGVLEIHPWGSRNQDLEHPDRLIFDLDPDESLAWAEVAGAAVEVRVRLKKIGLSSFLKTTGGKGLHVVAPMEPKLDWAAAKDFAHRFVLALEKANPKLYLTKMTKAARTGKIYLDYLRNERGATAVAPYSPRARAGAGVSMPLAWAEIAAGGEFAAVRPSFRVADFAGWRGRLSKDPWKTIAATHQTLDKGVL